MFGQNGARHIYNKDADWYKKTSDWLTLPKVVKKANPNYRTAHFGKWHIAMVPKDAGFDYDDGMTSNVGGEIFGDGRYGLRFAHGLILVVMLRHQTGLLGSTVFASMAVGTLWSEPFSYLTPVMAPGLMIVLFLSFLKVFPKDVWAALKLYPARLSLLVVIKLIVLPVGVYALAVRLAPDYAFGLFLLAGTSTAVASPFMTQIIRGNVAFVLVMAVATTLLVPFSLPALIGFLAGERQHHSLFGRHASSPAAWGVWFR